MGKFNTVQKVTTDTVNFEGEDAFALTPKQELATILFTSFLNKQFYRDGDATMNRIVELIPEAGYEFAAKAAVLGRNQYNMRSTSHVVAGEVACNVSGTQWTAPFFNAVTRLPSDMGEILSYYQIKNGGKLTPMSKSMQRGMKKAFEKFDSYQIAKYRMENKDISLIDIVRLIRPVPTERNQIAGLVDGTLKSTETWEAKVSATGQKEAEQTKSDAWKDLLDNGTIGYKALIRNIRNIVMEDASLIPIMAYRLTNKKAVQDAGIMPVELYVAYREFNAAATGLSISQKKTVTDALNKAFEFCCDNIVLPAGDTLVALDISSSMTWGDGNKSPYMLATPLAVALTIKGCNLALFNNSVTFKDDIADMKPLAAIDTLINNYGGGGTHLGKIFESAQLNNRTYENFIILSDHQSYTENSYQGSDYKMLKDYQRFTSKRANLFSIDVAGYGSHTLPQKNVALMAGFHRETLAMLAKTISNPNALVEEIEAVTF